MPWFEPGSLGKLTNDYNFFDYLDRKTALISHPISSYYYFFLFGNPEQVDSLPDYNLESTTAKELSTKLPKDRLSCLLLQAIVKTHLFYKMH